MGWLNRIRERFAGAQHQKSQQQPVGFTDDYYATLQYLDSYGLFGEGDASNNRLNQALHFSILRRSLEGRSSYDAAILQQHMAEMLSLPVMIAGEKEPKAMAHFAPAESKYLLDLLASPPNPLAVIEATARANKGVSGLLSRISFGRLGALPQAERMWADLAAYQLAVRAVESFIRAKEMGMHDASMAALSLFNDAGIAVPNLEGGLSGRHQHGHHLQSAIYNLQHPEQFRQTIKDHFMLIESLGDAVRRGHSLGHLADTVSAAGLMVGADGEPLSRREAAIIYDVTTMVKQSDRLRAMVVASRAEEKVPDSERRLVEHLLTAVEKMQVFARPYGQLQHKWEYAPVVDRQSDIWQQLAQQRQVRALMASQAHDWVEVTRRALASGDKEAMTHAYHGLQHFHKAAVNVTQVADALAIAAMQQALADISPQAQEKLLAPAQKLTYVAFNHYGNGLVDLVNAPTSHLLNRQQETVTVMAREMRHHGASVKKAIEQHYANRSDEAIRAHVSETHQPEKQQKAQVAMAADVEGDRHLSAAINISDEKEIPTLTM